MWVQQRATGEQVDSFHSPGFEVKLRLSKSRYYLYRRQPYCSIFGFTEAEMFCPHCGNEILSERVRFCTRCSFPLTTVKEIVVTEAAKSKAEEGEKNYPLRQLDVSLGAGLMIIGLIQAIVVQIGFLGGGGTAHELLMITLALGLFFCATLMFSQLTPRHRGLTVGATMIFLGSLIGIAVGLAGGGPPALFTIVGIFLLISLFWAQLSGAFKRLFFDKELARESPNHAPLQPMFKAADTAHPMLPQMQSSAVVDLNPQEMKTKERAQPFSITEDSTSLLNKN
jgi:hypothetical protein